MDEFDYYYAVPDRCPAMILQGHVSTFSREGGVS